MSDELNIDPVTGDTFSDVIVKNLTLGNYPPYLAEPVLRAVKDFAAATQMTNREAAVIVGQSFGIRCHFS